VNAAKPWSWLGYGVVYLCSFVMAGFLLPGLDSLEPIRLNAFLAISAAYWLRFAVAKYRNETGRSYIVWMFLMVLTPFGLMFIGIWRIPKTRSCRVGPAKDALKIWPDKFPSESVALFL
jgi:hypothetical protein